MQAVTSKCIVAVAILVAACGVDGSNLGTANLPDMSTGGAGSFSGTGLVGGMAKGGSGGVSGSGAGAGAGGSEANAGSGGTATGGDGGSAGEAGSGGTAGAVSGGNGGGSGDGGSGGNAGAGSGGSAGAAAGAGGGAGMASGGSGGVGGQVQPQALFVAGSQTLGRSDTLMVNALKNDHGLAVVVKSDAESRTRDANGMVLVLISESANSVIVGAKFADVPVGVMVLDPGLFDEMRMTGPTWDQDAGIDQAEREIQLKKPGHPLAAGLTGRVIVANSDVTFSWGVPAVGGVIIATLDNAQTRATIFAYDRGASMTQGNALGRRIGWFAHAGVVAELNDNGRLLFKAAIDWLKP